MKKAICFLCAALFLFGLCGCGRKATDSVSRPTETASTQRTVESESIVSETTATATDESLREKLIREIDTACKQELSLPENSSTAKMVTITEKYTQKWANTAEKYYYKILEYNDIKPLTPESYTADDLHDFITEMKTNRDTYTRAQADRYRQVLEAIHAGGTISSTIYASYWYDLEKDWALQMVDIYQQLNPAS